MDIFEIIKYMTDSIQIRKECLDIAFNRGLGNGMQIENWILLEMRVKLEQLKENGTIDFAEIEHKYPIKKTRRFEHCDLWWSMNGDQHWAEVKTIVLANDEQKGKFEDIINDLDKNNRLRPSDFLHHLTYVFPMESSDNEHWTEQLKEIYEGNGFIFKNQWNYELEHDKILFMILAGNK